MCSGWCDIWVSPHCYKLQFPISLASCKYIFAKTRIIWSHSALINETHSFKTSCMDMDVTDGEHWLFLHWITVFVTLVLFLFTNTSDFHFPQSSNTRTLSKFFSPTAAQLNNLKNNFKYTLKLTLESSYIFRCNTIFRERTILAC